MADDNDTMRAKLGEGIAYFEKMRQAMPDDRTTLEFLSVAYGQIGDEAKCCDALVSLARVLLRERDFDSAERIAERLGKYDDPAAKAMMVKVMAARAPTPDLTPEEPSKEGISGTYGAAVKAEVNLVKILQGRRLIDDALAETLTKKISEHPGSGRFFLISTLTFLERENSPTAEKAIALIADATSAPPIPLEAFDIQPELARTIPESYVRVRGTIPFARLGDTLLVGMLDPFDDLMKRETAAAAGCPCRFYTVEPAAVDNVLERLYGQHEEENKD